MRTPRDPIYAGHRYPAEIISYAVWLYFRFPLSLRMVEEMLAARGISVTHGFVRIRRLVAHRRKAPGPPPTASCASGGALILQRDIHREAIEPGADAAEGDFAQ